MPIQRVGEMLVEAGVITRDQLSHALRQQATAGGRLGTNLVELGLIDEKTLAAFLARQLSLPSVTAAQLDRVTPAVLRLVSAQAAERLRAVPIREDAGRLWVAMADPTDRNAVAELERISGRPVRTMVAPELLIQYALEKHYHCARRPRVVEVRSGGSDLIRLEQVAPPAPTAGSPSAQAGEAPVYRPIPMAADALESVTGYLDEAVPPAAPAMAIVPERLTLKTLTDELLAATRDEAVLDLAARYLAQDVPRVWVFLLRGGELKSFGGRGIDPLAMAGAQAPLGELPQVAQALASGEVMTGRVSPSLLGRLATPLGAYQETLGVVLPVRIGKQAVGAILGLDAGLDTLRRKPELDKLAQKIDQALHINYLRRLLAQP